MSKELTGSNREVVGSPAYFEKLHNAHFSGTLRCSQGDDFARSLETLAENRFCHLFKPNLERIVQELERDLEQGLRDNDYIRDENADNLRATLKQLERCGVRCYSLERKIDDLSWFVGGDPEKIRQLQQKLNELGIGERLEEDGVYGKKTRFAWENYLYALEHGSVPTLMMSDPLRSKKTGFEIGASKYGKQHNLQNAIMRNKTHPYIRIDPTPQGTETAWVRGKKTQITYPHINFDPLPDGGRTYNWIQERYNHKALTAKQYDHLKDLQAHGKKVQFKGKILLVAGIALDALELGVAVHEDLTDADKKLGEKTLYTSISIGGRWAGSAIGAQIGAWAGTLTGPAAPVAVPVLSLVGGIAGSALAQLAVDISAVGD